MATSGLGRLPGDDGDQRSVDRLTLGRLVPLQLLDSPNDRPLGRRAIGVTRCEQLIRAHGGRDGGVGAVALHHRLRSAPYVDVGDHPAAMR